MAQEVKPSVAGEESYLNSLSEADWIARGYRIITQHEYEELSSKAARKTSWVTLGKISFPWWVRLMCVLAVMLSFYFGIWTVAIFPEYLRLFLTLLFTVICIISLSCYGLRN